MKKVLVVDDDQDILEQAKAALGRHYVIVTGTSGKECLDLIGPERPDLIILDVIMAHLGDGLDCLKSLKADPASQKIPVMMMTSVNDVYDYRSQIEASFYPHDRWLDKPVKSDVLLKAVREMLGD